MTSPTLVYMKAGEGQMVRCEDGESFGELLYMDGDRVKILKKIGAEYRWINGRCLKLVLETPAERVIAEVEVYSTYSLPSRDGVEVKAIVNCLQVI